MNRRCDNEDCKFLYKGECIQSWWCIAGVAKCPDYKSKLSNLENLYNTIIKKPEENEDE